MQALDTRPARAEGGDLGGWARFIGATDSAQWLQGWLAVLCQQLPDTRSALLLLAGEEEQTFGAAATWPEGFDAVEPLAAAAQKALAERRGVTLAGIDRGVATSILAYPLQSGERLHAAVVVALRALPEPAVQAALRQIHWACGWLLEQALQQQLAERQRGLERVLLANRVIATALQHDALMPAAHALANELARSFDCDRVAIGLDEPGGVRVAVLSHSADFDARSRALRQIAEAMEETLDIGRPLLAPTEGDAQLLAAAHAAWALEDRAVAVWSVPLMAQGRTVGVLSFERTHGAAPDEAALQACRVLGELLGPMLALLQRAERSALARARETLAEGWRALAGPGQGGVKLIAALAAAVLLGLALARGEHRVSAKTIVEGELQRAAVAPFDGFVIEAPVRAGDVVRRGDLLARLDDRELQAERARWLADAAQADQKLRQAQAQGERAAMNVLRAQAAQAAAQLASVDDRLARARLVAPFDGVVASGDLRQAIGAPVQQGKLLFEVAPLDAWRVTLQVDERDIAALAIGQQGQLRLAGRPGETLPFTVAQVSPVAVAEEGRNFFRVEARMMAASPALAHLKPGMEGVGKVEVGQRSLLWIWFHPLLDWLRLTLWSLWP